jgi:hypothetical protein
MSRFAEASARAGRAVPDNPRVDWAKEREAADRLLRGAAAEQAVPPPPPPTPPAPPPTAVASPPALDSVEPAFSWPADFDLDEIDLSRDPHARDFRRPRPITLQRVEVDDQTPPRRSQLRHESAASSPPLRVSAIVMPPRENAASSKRGIYRDLARAEASLGIPRWVMMVAVGLIVLLASVALLTYLLRHRDVAAGPPYVDHLSLHGWSVPSLSIWPSRPQAKRVKDALSDRVRGSLKDHGARGANS